MNQVLAASCVILAYTNLPSANSHSCCFTDVRSGDKPVRKDIVISSTTFDCIYVLINHCEGHAIVHF